MKSLLFTVVASAFLAGCVAHVPEGRDPGVTISGTAGAGVKYQNGATTAVTNTELKIGLGGSI